MNPIKSHHYLAVSIALSVFATPALSSSTLLEEVIVTAQKREENSQDIPISISAFSGDALKAVGITSTDALAQVTPGLQSLRTVGSSTPFLRGIGTQSNVPGDEGAVATYIDGVFIGSSISAAQSFNNIERVEVLKGPQGTLFGRNATGGVIHIVTKKPEFETGGSLSVSYGNYETAGVNFYGTTGISETIASDLAVYYSDQMDGYGTNVITDNEVGTNEILSIRNKWLWNASESTKAIFSMDYTKKESSYGVGRHLVDGALGINGQFIFGGCLARGGTAAACAAAAQAGAFQFNGDFHDASESVDPFVEADDWGVSLRLEHSLEFAQLVSLTSYRETDEEQHIDAAQAPGSFLDVNFPSSSETLVQELQLISTDDDLTLQWQLGLFYMNNDSRYDPNTVSGALLAAAGLEARVFDIGQETDSIAVYGQSTYSFTDQLRLTLGLRYTEDERERYGEERFIAGGMPVIVIPADGEESFEELTWRVALDYDVAENMLLFATYNRGFKSGLFNTLDTNPVIEPEIIDAYEIGFKSTLMDGAMRLNGSVFFYDYQDLQLQAVIGTQAILVNAADSEVFGAELEWLWSANDSLDLYANISYLDTEYSNYPEAVGFQPTGIGGNNQIVFDASGNELNRSPDFTFNVGGTYSILLESGGILRANANYYYNDGFFWEQTNRARQDSYGLLTAGISWLSPQEQYEVRISGNNLLDEEHGLYYSIGATGESISPAAPLTYGVEFKYNFF